MLPTKRQKVQDSAEELQQKLIEKDGEIDLLNQKFEYILNENNKLRKDLEILVKRIEDEKKKNEESEDFTSDDDEMEVNETPATEEINKKKADTCAISANVPVKKQQLPRRKEAALKDGPVSSKNAKGSGKRDLVPIVTTYNVNVRDVTTKLEDVLGHKDYNIRILGKHVTNIGVCTLDDFAKLRKLLSEEGVNYYTHTPKSQRPFSVVVKGLSDTFEVDEVREYIGSVQVNINVMGLHKLGGNRWLFQLSRESDLKGFYNMRYILHCRVTMEKHVRRDLIQCYNCQRFGHVAINCNMPYRCVKCGESHGPGKCPVPPKGENHSEVLSTDPITGEAVRKIGLPVKCVNCGTEGHAASFRECPKRLELLQRRAAVKVSKGPVYKPAPAPPRIVPGKGPSYAAAARSASERNRLQRQVAPAPSAAPVITLAAARSEFDFIDGDCRRLFGGSLLDCLNRMKGFAREYRLLKNDSEKSRALLGMLMSLQHDG